MLEGVSRGCCSLDDDAEVERLANAEDKGRKRRTCSKQRSWTRCYPARLVKRSNKKLCWNQNSCRPQEDDHGLRSSIVWRQPGRGGRAAEETVACSVTVASVLVCKTTWMCRGLHYAAVGPAAVEVPCADDCDLY